MKKVLLIATIALLAVVAVDAQRYYSKAQKDRVLANKPEFVLNIGTGLATDTTLLSTTSDYGRVMWDGPNPFVVTNLNVAIESGIGDDTLGIHLCWSDTINDSTPYYLNTTALAVDSTNASGVGGLDDTTFDDATIPKDYYVWWRVTNITAGQKSISVTGTATGHMQDNNGN